MVYTVAATSLVRNFIVGLTCILFLSPCVAIDCESLAADMVEQFHPSKTLDEGKVSCAIDNGRTILMLPFASERDEYGSTVWDVEILIISNGSGKVIGRYFHRRAWWDDASILQFAPRIDVNSYRLSPHGSVFSVTANRNIVSAVVGGGVINLTLYLVQGNEIEPILNYFPAAEWYTHTSTSDECPYQSTEILRELSVERTMTNGLFDIEITESKLVRQEKLVGSECKLISAKPKIRRYVLRFDGNRYSIPKQITGR
jgi:hypothetical protein